MIIIWHSEARKRPKRMLVGTRIGRLPYVLVVLMACAALFMSMSAQGDISDIWRTDRTLSDDGQVCEGGAPSEEGALSGYPSTGITIEQHRQGVIILPMFITFLMFYGLAICCDKYFQPALEAICENLNLGDDVAGATFMAAGGSAPELATSLLGVFVSKSDIGIGTIVGSAVFNVLFVISACALLAPDLDVTWYPLARDCIYYCMSILALTVVVLDQSVQTWEACFLFLLYILYCVIMRFNPEIERRMQDYVNSFEDRKPNQVQSTIIAAKGPISMIIYIVIIVNTFTMLAYDEGEQPAVGIVNHLCAAIFVIEFSVKNYGFGIVGYWKSAPDAFDGVLVALIGVEYLIAGSGGTMAVFRGLKFIRFLRFLRVFRILRVITLLTKERKDASTQTGESESESELVSDFVVPTPVGLMPVMPEPAAIVHDTIGPVCGTIDLAVCAETGLPGLVPSGGEACEKERHDIQASPVTLGKEIDNGQKTYVGDTGGSSVTGQSAAVDCNEENVDASPGEDNAEDDDDDGDDDDEDDGPFDPFNPGEGYFDKILWVITLPLVLLIFVTVPDCKSTRFEKLWPLTFMLCIVWIAILAYVMVWMATTFGVVTGIPDPVMGLTLLAAGTSIPDALSSLAVARKGQGDMAVSSSVGSNIFDILVGLPVPWMLYGIFNQAAPISICSSSLGVMIITLFVMVALVVCSINTCQWKLTKKLGYGFMALYILFVTESLLLEYDLIMI